MNRLIALATVIVSLILSSCSRPQAAAPPEIPTVPSQPATPTPTMSPTPVPTPDPGSLQSLQPDAETLCANIFADYETGFVNHQWAKGFGPKAAAFINLEYETWKWELSDLFSSAASVDQVNSIICIRQSRISKGFYTTGGTGYQLEWDVWLVKWPEGTLLGNRKFTGGHPPTTVRESGDHYGSPPEEEVSHWLAVLLQEPFFAADAPITHLAFSTDESTLVVGTPKTIDFLQVTGGDVIHTYPILEQRARKIVYSPDNTRVAVSICSSMEEKECLQSELRVIDIVNDSILLTLDGATPDTFALAISPDGSTLATCSSDIVKGTTKSTTTLWDIASGRSVLAFTDVIVPRWLLFTQDGKGFINESSTHVNYQLRDAASGEVLSAYHRERAYSTGQELSPQSNVMAESFCLDWECLQSKVEVFDYQTGAVLQELPASDSEIYAIAFSPDGAQLAVSSCAQSQSVLFEQTPYPICVAGMVTIWDLASGSILRTLYPSTKVIYALVFSPDQSTLVTGDAEGKVKIWELSED